MTDLIVFAELPLFRKLHEGETRSFKEKDLWWILLVDSFINLEKVRGKMFLIFKIITNSF